MARAAAARASRRTRRSRSRSSGRAKVPRPFARTGYIGDYYFIAQWFPKLGVLEDGGWNTHQFHSATEFYADFGVYDVRITVPRGVRRRRHRAVEAPRTDNADGTTTHRYRGEDVHDFAWTTSPRLHRRDADVRAPDAAAASRCGCCCSPSTRGQADRHFAATAATLKLLRRVVRRLSLRLHHHRRSRRSRAAATAWSTRRSSPAARRWLAPRDVHDAGDRSRSTRPAISGGTASSAATSSSTRGWTKGSTPSRPRACSTRRSRRTTLEQRYFGGFIPWAFRDIPFSRASTTTGWPATATTRRPTSRPRRRSATGRRTATSITYNKTALWLHTLERHLGWPTLQRILSTYFERWKFRHPQPDGLLRRRQRGQRPGPDVVLRPGLPQLEHVRLRRAGSAQRSREPADAYRTTVVVAALRRGDVPGGRRHDVRRRRRRSPSGGTGVDRRAIYVYERPARAASAAGRSAARAAARRRTTRTTAGRSQPRGRRGQPEVGLKWMVWLQDLMLTYAFFVMSGSRRGWTAGGACCARRRSWPASSRSRSLLRAAAGAHDARRCWTTHLGRSLAADSAADGVNYDWWQEFTSQATGLGDDVHAAHHRLRRHARQHQQPARRPARDRCRSLARARASTSLAGRSSPAASSIATRGSGRRAPTASLPRPASSSSASSGSASSRASSTGFGSVNQRWMPLNVPPAFLFACRPEPAR